MKIVFPGFLSANRQRVWLFWVFVGLGWREKNIPSEN
jgi:hypothetical protein